jgi:hypothetical protein
MKRDVAKLQRTMLQQLLPATVAWLQADGYPLKGKRGELSLAALAELTRVVGWRDAAAKDGGQRTRLQWKGEVCQRCKRRNVVGFSVADDVWARIVGDPDVVFCTTCFDEAAEAAGVSYDFEGVFPVPWCSEESEATAPIAEERDAAIERANAAEAEVRRLERIADERGKVASDGHLAANAIAAERDELRAEVVRLEALAKGVVATNRRVEGALRDKLERTESECHHWESEAVRLRKDRDAIEAERDELRAEVERLRRIADERGKVLQNLRAEVERLEAEQRDWREACRRYKDAAQRANRTAALAIAERDEWKAKAIAANREAWEAERDAAAVAELTDAQLDAIHGPPQLSDASDAPTVPACDLCAGRVEKPAHAQRLCDECWERYNPLLEPVRDAATTPLVVEAECTCASGWCVKCVGISADDWAKVQRLVDAVTCWHRFHNCGDDEMCGACVQLSDAWQTWRDALPPSLRKEGGG